VLRRHIINYATFIISCFLAFKRIIPIYEYICEACEAPHEALQKMSDDALTDCPSCGQAKLRKKISAAGFRLSGSGWYETDFKSGKKKNLTESANAKKETKKDSKKDSKPAKKSSQSGGSGSSH